MASGTMVGNWEQKRNKKGVKQAVRRRMTPTKMTKWTMMNRIERALRTRCSVLPLLGWILSASQHTG
jgi:hypothetical protein